MLVCMSLSTWRKRSRALFAARTLLAAIAMAAIALLTSGSGCGTGEAGDPEFLCNPGESIFCRCPGGAPGTKRCNDSGESFQECEPCEARPSSGPGGPGSGPGPGAGPGAGGPGAGGPGAGGAGGAGGGGTGTGDVELLGVCTDGSDCQSGLCESSFCTIACAVVSDCPYPESECVTFGAQTICMPSCATAGDCANYNAPPSACGYTKAIDNWDVTVCADWGDQHQLMPQFTDCLPFDHAACNLGYQQRQLVCDDSGRCVEGCFVNADCPPNTTCNGGGGFGQCI